MREALTWMVCCFLGLNASAQVWLEQTQLDTQTVAHSLEIPWDMQRWGEDTLVFTERTGKVKRLAVNTGIVDELLAISDVAVEGQAGLMGIQLHPQFPQMPFVFLALNYYDGGNIKLRVDQYEYMAGIDSLFYMNAVIEGIPSSNSNVGGRLLIDNGQLYLCVGDAKNNEAAQDPTSLNGKILRLELDGSVPSSNPYNNEVFSLGHRNPQGLVRGADGNIYFSEHGPASNDELNRLQKGKNYGWPLMSGPCSESNAALCDSLDIVDPVMTWSPTIAPAGIEFHDGSLVAEWENTVLMASLKERRLIAVEFAGNGMMEGTQSLFFDVMGRIRDVLIADGRIFVCTSNRDALGTPTAQDDRIVELIPSAHNTIEETHNTPWFQQRGRAITVIEPGHDLLQAFDLTGQMVWTEHAIGGKSLQLPTSLHGLFLLRSAKSGRSVMIFVP